MTGTVQQRDFSQRIVGVALLVRLLAITVALFGMIGQPITGTMLTAVLVLSATSFSFLMYPSVARFVMRHPLAIVADLLLTLVVIAVLGVESPLVLATFSTALIMGILFERRIAVLGATTLVAGFLLVAQLQPSPTSGFMINLGIPALYVGLVAIGAVVRHAHERELVAARELVDAHRAVASADERARLAREMHDSLGKTLHGIALAAEALPTWVERDPPTAVRYAHALAEAADQAAAEARSLLVRLRSDEPDRPLAQVFADQCRKWAAETGVECVFETNGAVDLSTDARYEALAIVSEALENVHRHAQADRVTVTLAGGDGGSVRIEVADDGLGFLVREDGGSPPHHFGLTGMHERAAEAGAHLRVTSQPGRGTRVVLELDPTKENAGVR
jgi:signal transduction histidine kinase